MLRLKWFGHSFWKIIYGNTVIVTDPFTDIGYPLPKNLSADFVLSSHDHFDHNNVDLIKGNYRLLNEPGCFEEKGIKFELIPVWHDENEGQERGRNLLMKINPGNRTILHCGDLGHTLSSEIINRLGNIDVLLIPVGGVYTINAEKAKELCDILAPKLIFPMHYRTPVLNFELEPLKEFTKLYSSVTKRDSTEIELTDDKFKKDTPLVITLRYA